MMEKRGCQTGGVCCEFCGFGWCGVFWVVLGSAGCCGVVGRGCENVRRMNRTNDRHRAERVVEMIRNLQRLDGW